MCSNYMEAFNSVGANKDIYLRSVGEWQFDVASATLVKNT